jgi:hypothetical protein
MSFAWTLQNKAKKQQQPHIDRVPVAGPAAIEKTNAPPPERQHNTGLSAQVSNVNSLPLDNMLRAITVVQQIMTGFSDACCVKARQITGHYKNCLRPYGTERPLEFIGPSKS